MAASYDRELIAQMLEGARRGDLHQFSVESIERAISQLRAAENADAAGVRTASIAPAEAKGEAVAWRNPTPYGVGYSFASEEVMRDMVGYVAESFDAPQPAGGEAVAVPEGFVLVPRKANGNMIHAAVRVWDSSSAPDPEQLQVASETWNAMLAAAPTVSAEGDR